MNTRLHTGVVTDSIPSLCMVKKSVDVYYATDVSHEKMTSDTNKDFVKVL